MTRILTALVALVSLGLVLGAAAPIDDAKDSCQIGERIDGYLGVVDGASPPEAALRRMREINQARANAYADLARRNGVTVEVTAKVAAEKLINKAPSGHCVQNESGEWVRVP
jgi:uncharacterized protein YdbL (DUF1318 family)